MSPSLPDLARRRAGGLARRARAGRPLVTAVVEARGAEPDVRAAIDSARDQPTARLRILVVLVDEQLRPVAEAAAAGDWRVRVLAAPGADPAAVRRLGAERARTPHVVFLPPRRQRLAPGALTALLGDGVGADTVVAGGVAGGGEELAKPLLGRLLVPRSTWLSTPDDGEPAGQTSAVRLLARAPRLGRLDGSPRRRAAAPEALREGREPVAGLEARIVHDTEMLWLLPAAERSRRAAGALTRDLPPFLLAVERCDDDQWTSLRDHASWLVETAGESLAEVPVEDRVLAWLGAADRRAELVAFVADRRFAGGTYPTTVRDGMILAVLGVRDVPDHVLELSEAESPLRARLRRSRVEGPDLVLEVWGAISRLDEEDPVMELRLAGPTTRTLQPQRSVDPAVTRWMESPTSATTTVSPPPGSRWPRCPRGLPARGRGHRPGGTTPGRRQRSRPSCPCRCAPRGHRGAPGRTVGRRPRAGHRHSRGSARGPGRRASAPRTPGAGLGLRPDSGPVGHGIGPGTLGCLPAGGVLRGRRPAAGPLRGPRREAPDRGGHRPAPGQARARPRRWARAPAAACPRRRGGRAVGAAHAATSTTPR